MNLFIAGVEKCGTSSLAEWFVSTGLATYRVADVKEPLTYLAGEVPDEHSGLIPPGVVLDASVAYSSSPEAVSRMPGRNTKIVLCLRNSFDRCFSSFSFLRVIAERGPDAQQLIETLPHPEVHDPMQFFEKVFELWTASSPHHERDHLRKHFLAQADNICGQTFAERIEYEIGFFLSRRTFPFFSVLGGASFFNPLRNLLGRYHPERVFLVTLDTLESESVRRDFVMRLLGIETSGHLPALSQGVNATRQLSIAHERPNFADPQWDSLRSYFLQDWSEFESLAQSRGVSMRYVSTREMQRNLVQHHCGSAPCSPGNRVGASDSRCCDLA